MGVEPVPRGDDSGEHGGGEQVVGHGRGHVGGVRPDVEVVALAEPESPGSGLEQDGDVRRLNTFAVSDFGLPASAVVRRRKRERDGHREEYMPNVPSQHIYIGTHLTSLRFTSPSDPRPNRD